MKILECVYLTFNAVLLISRNSSTTFYSKNCNTNSYAKHEYHRLSNNNRTKRNDIVSES